MGAMQKTITPIDGSLYVERPYASAGRDRRGPGRGADGAAKAWRTIAVAERARLLGKAVDAFVTHKDADRRGDHPPDGPADRPVARARCAASRSAPAT